MKVVLREFNNSVFTNGTYIVSLDQLDELMKRARFAFAADFTFGNATYKMSWDTNKTEFVWYLPNSSLRFCATKRRSYIYDSITLKKTQFRPIQLQ